MSTRRRAGIAMLMALSIAGIFDQLWRAVEAGAFSRASLRYLLMATACYLLLRYVGEVDL